MPMPISNKQIFIQHSWNVASNTGSVPVEIYDPRDRSKPIVVIPAGQ